MTEAEWLVSDDPAAMLATLRDGADEGWLWPVSDRKLRLWVEACRAVGNLPGYVGELGSDAGLRVAVAYWGSRDARSQLPSPTRAALLREVVGSPFRPVTLRRSWLTYDALALSDGAHDMRCWETLPIVADALEEAGCDDEILLRHLRGEEPVLREVPRQTQTVEAPLCRLVGWRPLRGPHVRGCWALDFILGKG